jgi:hypothetical protein
MLYLSFREGFYDFLTLNIERLNFPTVGNGVFDVIKGLAVIESGDSAKIEIVAEEMEHLAADQPFYIRERVQTIHKPISRFDYEDAGKKAKEFLVHLSYP